MTAKREETMLVSAYGLFFRETQAAIKNQHKGASFSEISNMVATMWDGLDPEHKNVYKKKAESSKKEYINALTAYRTSLKSNRTVLLEDRDQNTSPSTAVSSIVLHTQCNSVVNNMSDNKHHLSTQPLTGLPQNHFNREQVSVKPLQVLSVVPVQVIPSSISAPPMVATNSLVKQQEPLANAEKKQPPNKVCIRQGCSNMAVSNPEWENEYCSCDCVLNHCREVYNAWVTLQRNLRQHK